MSAPIAAMMIEGRLMARVSNWQTDHPAPGCARCYTSASGLSKVLEILVLFCVQKTFNFFSDGGGFVFVKRLQGRLSVKLFFRCREF